MADPLRQLKSYRNAFPKQAAWHADTHRFCGLVASSQSGKTYSTADKFLRRVLKTQKAKNGTPGEYWVIVANSQIAPPVKAALARLIPENSRLIDHRRQRTSRAFWDQHTGWGHVYLTCGAVIRFRSFEQGEGLVSAPLRGFWVDEAARCNDSAAWGNIFQRTMQTKGWGLMSTSPTTQGVFFREWYTPNKDNPDFGWHEWNSYDAANGGLFDVEDVEAAKRRLPPHIFKREHLASWDSSLGQIYDNFDPVLHVKPYYDEKEYRRRWTDRPDFTIGLDMGAYHPTVITVASHLNDSYYVHESIALYTVSMTEVVSRVLDAVFRYEPTRIFYDYESAGKWFSAEWAARTSKLHLPNRVMTQCAYKLRNQGIRLVYDAFSTGRLHIDASCTDLVLGIRRYSWDVENIQEDAPIREDDDHVDSMRYAVASHIKHVRMYQRGSYWQTVAGELLKKAA